MTRLLAVVIVLVAGLFAIPGVDAQEVSPEASPTTTTGVTVTPLGLFEVQPGTVVPVVRIELAAGAALPPHSSLGPAVAQVDSGQVSYLDIEGVVHRAQIAVMSPSGTPEPMGPGAMESDVGMGLPEAPDQMPAADDASTTGDMSAFAIVQEDAVVGEETPLGPGEGVAFGPDVVHTFSNTGNEPAVLIIVGEFPPDQPPFQFVSMGATPEASPMP